DHTNLKRERGDCPLARASGWYLIGKRMPRLLVGARATSLHIIAIEEVLVAQVQPAIRHNRIGPGVDLTPLRLLEPALFPVFVRRRFHQCNLARALRTQVDMPIGVANGPNSHRWIFPLHLSRQEVNAEQTFAGGSVKVLIDKNHAADTIADGLIK